MELRLWVLGFTILQTHGMNGAGSCERMALPVNPTHSLLAGAIHEPWEYDNVHVSLLVLGVS
jgi:hypothetical protein